jgi:hypothetical protein
MSCLSTYRQWLTMSRRIVPLAVLCLLTLTPDAVRAAETAETILIRAALGRDLTGRRRGDAELMVDAYNEDHFVVYDGGQSASAASWTPIHVDYESYEQELGRQLGANRYDVARAVVFIGVWKDKAFVTTIDSGLVIDRQSSQSTPYYDRRFWTFAKEDEEWLATGFIAAYGDTASTAAPDGIADADVAQALADEAAAWNSGSPGEVAGFAAEEFIAVESKFSSNPALWMITFADRDEYREWLDERLTRVSYTVNREVLHVRVSADGNEAVAVTRDQVRADHVAGSAVHEQERHTYWLLQRRTGDWVATWAFWKSKAIPASTSGGTAP